MNSCAICFSKNMGPVFDSREMMFGLSGNFFYSECLSCGCVQLMNAPDDLSLYYPVDYYSYSSVGRLKSPSTLKRLKSKAWLGEKFFGSKILSCLKRPGYFYWLENLGLKLDSKVLDVGCGSGSLLARMSGSGFSDLTGIDPYINATLYPAPGCVVNKCGLSDFCGSYDLIMLNHSLEHMPDQDAAFSDLNRLISDSGSILIRIPISGGYAFRKYKNNWVNLDPPRHYFLHTVYSISLLAKRHGFSVSKVFFDSTAQQIIGSELAMRGIPMSLASSLQREHFDEKQLGEINGFVDRLNREMDGDCAGFVLKKDS